MAPCKILPLQDLELQGLRLVVVGIVCSQDAILFGARYAEQGRIIDPGNVLLV